jgi:hypothetical protein
MKTAVHTEASFSQLLWNWLTYRISQRLAEMRPAYRASDVATAVAASNNPSGV